MSQHEYELTQEQAQEIIQLGEALKRLNENPDFKKIFSEGFFKDEAVRVVGLMGEPEFKNSDYILHRQIGIAQSQAYLREIALRYHSVVTQMNEQAALDEAEAE